MPLAAQLARLFLVAALLAAQQGALAHTVWHSADVTHDESPATESGLLCDQHSALGTVLGALGNAQSAGDASAVPGAAIAVAPSVAAPATPLTPSSRDPPSRLM